MVAFVEVIDWDNDMVDIWTFNSAQTAKKFVDLAGITECDVQIVEEYKAPEAAKEICTEEDLDVVQKGNSYEEFVTSFNRFYGDNVNRFAVGLGTTIPEEYFDEDNY